MQSTKVKNNALCSQQLQVFWRHEETGHRKCESGMAKSSDMGKAVKTPAECGLVCESSNASDAGNKSATCVSSACFNVSGGLCGSRSNVRGTR